MAVSPTDPPGCGSQFFVTLADGIDYLDGKHCVFGHVVEGFETLDKINEAFLDKDGRPLQDIRIRHVEVLGESSSGYLVGFTTVFGSTAR
jgi:peptidyl-prolyl cis-trans isomerase-like 4